MSEALRTCHILLLRHGLTDANAGGVIQGHRPVPLNAVGHEQARCLARRLGDFSPAVEVLISSDLSRARQTAEPIGAALGLPIRFDVEWRERGFGQWEGRTMGDINIWRAASGEADPPGAEPTGAFFERVRGALMGVAKGHAGETVAVVTHGGPVRVIAQMLVDGRLGLEEGGERPELVAIANCSIMHLVCSEYGDGVRFRVACMNDVRHLEGMGATARDAG